MCVTGSVCMCACKFLNVITINCFIAMTEYATVCGLGMCVCLGVRVCVCLQVDITHGNGNAGMSSLYGMAAIVAQLPVAL